ncbi:c-type cytochrome [Cupriavidus agavae]|uniref:Cytochrome c553 n=1 Tax=Cupriavidus agavae TaxID=1001822 RepID=A0A4Q7RH10_9BURK|nr:cytochrome c [Cupriavidus agavae]RZT32511.1 cytochrome c553 [Cupriavidus agavae]
MNRFPLIRLMGALACVLASGGAQAVSSGAPPQKLSDGVAALLPMCAACHGIDGVSSIGLYPNLAGQKPEYVAKQLRDFKSGQRSDAVMRPMAEPLSDDMIEALSRHFGTMKPPR